MTMHNFPKTDRTTLVGVFDTKSYAQDAVKDLVEAGFGDDQIGIVARDAERATAESAADPNRASASDARASNVAAGATAGVATGAGVGALWAVGIAAGLLPAIGPVIAGGVLAAVLASAAGGAAIAGIVGALVGLGIPEEEARFYESEFQAGRTLVTVRAGDRFDDAQMILRRHGAYDIHTKDTYQSTDEYRRKIEKQPAFDQFSLRPDQPR